MAHTPIEFYVILPVDLFRGGTPTKHKFDYIRTMPPRQSDEVFDIKIDPKTNVIDHKSGGLSLFNVPNYAFGSHWWIVPAGTQLPYGFTLSKDLTSGKFKGHYTIRAMADMPLSVWKKTLLEWANENVIHIDESKKANKNV